MKYTEQAVETLDDAGSVIANKNIEIEQLRQRVAELENERDNLKDIVSSRASGRNFTNEQVSQIIGEREALKQAYESAEESVLALKETRNRLAEERDKATQYWHIAEGRCDALKKQRDKLLAAMYLITKRPVIEAFSIAEAAIASVKEK